MPIFPFSFVTRKAACKIPFRKISILPEKRVGKILPSLPKREKGPINLHKPRWTETLAWNRHGCPPRGFTSCAIGPKKTFTWIARGRLNACVLQLQLRKYQIENRQRRIVSLDSISLTGSHWSWRGSNASSLQSTILIINNINNFFSQ